MTMNKTRGKWTVFLLNDEMWLRNSEWCVSSVICIIPSVLTAVSWLAGCGRSDDVFWSLLGACGVVQMMPTSGEAGMIHHIGHATTCIYINNNQIIKHATDIRTPTTREIIEWLTLSFLGNRDLIWDLETLWRNVMRLMMTYELCPRCHDTVPHWGGALATHHDAWKPLGRPRCIRSHGLHYYRYRLISSIAIRHVLLRMRLALTTAQYIMLYIYFRSAINDNDTVFYTI